MVEHFQTLYPISPLLKEYIYCYYTVESASHDFISKHYSFPHTYNAVSLYSGGDIAVNNNALTVKGNNKLQPFCILQGKRQYPLLVQLEGCFSRITILFKPLGLNYFINKPLGEIMGLNPCLFTQWNSLKFSNMVNRLFTVNNMYGQLHHLENFLCNIYRPQELDYLKQALIYLTDFDNEQSIEEIAASVNLSLRTFNRMFKMHLGVSPVTHQRIARFRHSLENKLFNNKLKNLTEISYQSNFYDQSYFIKLYNQLSGSNPKALFSNVELLDNSKLAFQFIKSPVG